ATATAVAPATATAVAPATATAVATATAAVATATATAVAPATATPGGPVVYVVQPGDTPIGIANQFGVTVANLLAYNNISDPTTLRVNQELRIPPAGYTPPTPTPRRPTATPTPAATPTPSITLAAPVLSSPGNNAPFKGIENTVVLQWQNPGGLPAGVENVLYIGVLVAPDAIDWRFNDPLGAVTEFRVPEWLFGQAPQEFGRTYVWYVQAARVTRQDGQVTAVSPVSPPSTQFRFQWN
ncbi:MAG: LysM peptidoglycan-binding domain-containing protein, partial [Caldilineales bacterium]|nr:LysM peptidoglycan-binding domain-containing protein [Caldilineales bacterium]